MTVSRLNLVAAHGQTATAETVSRRVRRLQDEARSLARDHTRSLMALIVEAQMMAEEIATGGDAYPPGVRDLARRFAEEAEQKVQTLEVISDRVS